jgi:chemotaxis response regulator CheB
VFRDAQEAIRQGAVDEVLPLGQIPAAIAKRSDASLFKERPG